MGNCSAAPSNEKPIQETSIQLDHGLGAGGGPDRLKTPTIAHGVN